MSPEDRRAPVQGDFRIQRGSPGSVDGTIAWSEHESAWKRYAHKYGLDQSAESIAERRGFGYKELTLLLGHEPETWELRK